MEPLPLPAVPALSPAPKLIPPVVFRVPAPFKTKPAPGATLTFAFVAALALALRLKSLTALGVIGFGAGPPGAVADPQYIKLEESTGTTADLDGFSPAAPGSGTSKVDPSSSTSWKCTIVSKSLTA